MLTDNFDNCNDCMKVSQLNYELLIVIKSGKIYIHIPNLAKILFPL